MRSHRSQLFLLSFAFFTAMMPEVIRAHDWPQYRGPNREGVFINLKGEEVKEVWRDK